MQRNHPNRALFSYFITSFPNLTFFFPSLHSAVSHARLTSLRYLSRFLPFLYFFFFFPYAFLSSYRLLSSALLFRGTTRPFNRVAFSLARDPPVPYYSAIAPLFQFLRLSYSSLPLPVSAALYSHPVLPTPTAWRVIPRKPWYFVGHGVQSHGGPDEAWPYLPPTALPPT